MDILTTRSLNTFEEEEILRVLSRNKTDSTKNFAFVELINSLGNYTIDADKDIWDIEQLKMTNTNLHYGECNYHAL